jgi:hypothetical protein
MDNMRGLVEGAALNQWTHRIWFPHAWERQQNQFLKSCFLRNMNTMEKVEEIQTKSAQILCLYFEWFRCEITHWIKKWESRIWVSRSSGYEVFCLLVYKATQSVESQPTCRRNMSPSSEMKSKPSKKPVWTRNLKINVTCSFENSFGFQLTTRCYIRTVQELRKIDMA